MLTVGLTGGIAAGKSLASARLRELGAVLIDADALSREVVEPGTEGLAEVVSAFGRDVLTADGQLDRPALGKIIFGDSERRAALNAIIHPRVRSRAREIEAAADADAVVVHDIPLLVETGQGAAFHLVVVIDAPAELRLQRMVHNRGMREEDARARIAAQATDGQRREGADAVVDNSGSPDEAVAALDRLWEERLAPYNRNIALRRVAPRPVAAGTATSGNAGSDPAAPALVEYRKQWKNDAARLTARLLAVDKRLLAVEHIGASAVPGSPSEDVISLQLAVTDMGIAADLADALTAAGFPRVPAEREGTVGEQEGTVGEQDGGGWEQDGHPAELLHANADPQRAVNLYVRTIGSTQWRQCLALRDWLRANPGEAEVYAERQRHWAFLAVSGTDPSALAAARAHWFRTHADPRAAAWIAASGWAPATVSL